MLERIHGSAAPLVQSATNAQETRGGESFAGAIARAVEDANQEQVSASRTIQDLVANGEGTIHDAMIALGKADSSFRLLMEMRNRLIEGVNQLLDTRL